MPARPARLRRPPSPRRGGTRRAPRLRVGRSEVGPDLRSRPRAGVPIGRLEQAGSNLALARQRLGLAWAPGSSKPQTKPENVSDSNTRRSAITRLSCSSGSERNAMRMADPGEIHGLPIRPYGGRQRFTSPRRLRPGRDACDEQSIPGAGGVADGAGVGRLSAGSRSHISGLRRGRSAGALSGLVGISLYIETNRAARRTGPNGRGKRKGMNAVEIEEAVSDARRAAIRPGRVPVRLPRSLRQQGHDPQAPAHGRIEQVGPWRRASDQQHPHRGVRRRARSRRPWPR